MESRLIGTIARCKLCNQSKNWLGKYSSTPRIKNGQLWLSQYLNSVGITDSDQTYILEAIAKVKENVNPTKEIALKFFRMLGRKFMVEGHDDGQDHPFDHDRNEECKDKENQYFRAFIKGCKDAGNTEEICETFAND